MKAFRVHEGGSACVFSLALQRDSESPASVHCGFAEGAGCISRGRSGRGCRESSVCVRFACFAPALAFKLSHVHARPAFHRLPV